MGSPREETTAWLGMVVALASFAMLFGALFFAYAYVRAAAGRDGWPPEGVPTLPRGSAALNTGLLLAASVALQGAVGAARSGRRQRLCAAWALGGVFGLAFLVAQGGLWSALWRRGLTLPEGGPYASVFYGLTALHALHVAAGLLGVGAVLGRALRGADSASRLLGVRLWAMYWHFVGAVWLLMFVFVFVL